MKSSKRRATARKWQRENREQEARVIADHEAVTRIMDQVRAVDPTRRLIGWDAYGVPIYAAEKP